MTTSRSVMAAILALGLLAGCMRRTDAIPPEVVLEDLPEQETWDVTLALSMDGRRRALVRAPYLARYEHRDSTFARFGPAGGRDTARVHVEVFDEAGASSATVD